MARYFVDTNVLLYAFSLDPSHLQKSPKAIEALGSADWCASSQVLMELYANLAQVRHGIGPRQASQLIQEIADDREVVAVNRELVKAALGLHERYRISHWDAAIVAAARQAGAAILLTEDLSHGQDYAGVRVLNPFL